ncbi:MAG: RNA polymerase sigma factor [Acidimicrobiia bacterium]
MTDPKFDRVLPAAQAGADWAVDVLFRSYQPLLLRYFRAQEPRVADDLAGDVWLALARGLGGFTGCEAGFRGWLFTIARRRLIEHRRRAACRGGNEVSIDHVAVLVGGDDPAAEATDSISAQEAIDRLVGALTPDQAEVVLLRVVAGLSAGEVARMTGRSPGHVRVLQHRALRRLAEVFSVEAVTR